MNLGELRAAVKERLGVPTAGDPLITDAWANGAINTALTVVSSEKPWWWLLSSVTFQFNGGQAAMPSDLMKIEAIQAYGGLLEPVSRRDMLDQDQAPLDTFGWTVIGNVLWLVPAPVDLVPARMLYYRAEPVLAADSDVPLMPAVYHQKLVAYATYLGYSKRQDPVRAAPLLADYKDWVGRTQADQSPVKGPRRVRTHPRRTVVGAGVATLPAQPSITVGGVIDCTSTTRPLAVDGQLIFELDKRRLLQYEAALADWVPPRGVGFTGLSSSPPAQASDGELWFQGNTRLLVVRDVSAAAWLPVRGMVTPCTSSTRPAAPYEGQPIYETDTDRLLYYTTATTGWQAPWNLPWGLIGESAAGNTDQSAITSSIDVTSCSVTFTAVANRSYRVWGQAGSFFQSTTAGVTQLFLANGAGTALAGANNLKTAPGAGSSFRLSTTWASKIQTPAAGSITYKMRAAVVSGGALTIENSQSSARLWVVDEGPAGAPA